jgi:aminomethyltransferase
MLARMIKTQSTPLRDEHVALGAKMVEFAGWNMPVEYQGLRAEHQAVRERVGIFDVSHMGEIRVLGPNALATLEWVTTNEVARLKAGEAQYSLLPNFEGGLVDDLIVYCIKPNQEYLLCVNASNTDVDYDWIVENNKGADLKNESAQWGQIAVQGPQAVALTEKVFGRPLKEIATFTYASVPFAASTCLVARTGYTGEDGFEIFVPTEKTVELWRALVKAGATPAGLGARDTLRTEMKYSLYGHEIDAVTNPFAAGLGWVIKPDKKDFIGRAAMLAGKEKGLSQKLVGFKMVERGIPRQGYKLFSLDEREMGYVTSGTVSPTLNEHIGIGYVDAKLAAEGSEIFVEMRGRKVRAKICKTPFVKTSLTKEKQ